MTIKTTSKDFIIFFTVFITNEIIQLKQPGKVHYQETAFPGVIYHPILPSYA